MTSKMTHTKCCCCFGLRGGAIAAGVLSIATLIVAMFFTGLGVWKAAAAMSESPDPVPSRLPAVSIRDQEHPAEPPPVSDALLAELLAETSALVRPQSEDDQQLFQTQLNHTGRTSDGSDYSNDLPPGDKNATVEDLAENATEPAVRPPRRHLPIRVELGPLAVALALELVYLVLTLVMLHGVFTQRADLLLVWLVAAGFGLGIGSAGAALAAQSAFSTGTPRGAMYGATYLAGCGAYWYGWAVVLMYYRQITGQTHPDDMKQRFVL